MSFKVLKTLQLEVPDAELYDLGWRSGPFLFKLETLCFIVVERNSDSSHSQLVRNYNGASADDAAHLND